MDAQHLGDGAYISITDDGFVLTANHHDPQQATDRVYLDLHSAPALADYINRVMGRDKTDESDV